MALSRSNVSFTPLKCCLLCGSKEDPILDVTLCNPELLGYENIRIPICKGCLKLAGHSWLDSEIQDLSKFKENLETRRVATEKTILERIQAIIKEDPCVANIFTVEGCSLSAERACAGLRNRILKHNLHLVLRTRGFKALKAIDLRCPVCGKSLVLTPGSIDALDFKTQFRFQCPNECIYIDEYYLYNELSQKFNRLPEGRYREERLTQEEVSTLYRNGLWSMNPRRYSDYYPNMELWDYTHEFRDDRVRGNSITFFEYCADHLQSMFATLNAPYFKRLGEFRSKERPICSRCSDCHNEYCYRCNYEDFNADEKVETEKIVQRQIAEFFGWNGKKNMTMYDLAIARKKAVVSPNGHCANFRRFAYMEHVAIGGCSDSGYKCTYYDKGISCLLCPKYKPIKKEEKNVNE